MKKYQIYSTMLNQIKQFSLVFKWAKRLFLLVLSKIGVTEEQFNATPIWLRQLSPWVFYLFSICGFLLLYTMLVMSPDCGRGGLICYLLGTEEKKSATELLGGALKILGFGFITILGIWIANRRTDATEESASAQAESAREQAKAVLETEKGRRQERFRDAVSHLGHESESVRHGGSYALFRLALEDEDFREPIIEILCKHILRITGGEKYRKDHEESPSIEIQSLMALLFEPKDSRTPEMLKRFWRGIPPDLSGGYFRGLELKNAQFQRVRFDNAQLQEVNLKGAQFQKASFSGAQFLKANLDGAQFQKANFSGVKFQGTHMEEAQFQGSIFHDTQFQVTRLTGAQFQGARFCETRFQGGGLSETQFQGAHLVRVKFQCVNLSEAQFQGANFYSTEFQVHPASLNGVSFGGVSSQGTQGLDFHDQIEDRIGERANLSGISFSGGLSQGWVDQIFHEVGDLMPEDVRPSFKLCLENNIGQNQYRILPDGAEIKTESYDKKATDKWIAEYEKAMRWK